ncbi:MAG: flagellar hook-basal body complex protein, partial [Phycisphaerae bacterium]|nr:flagellar hook-basal body complex protein [Phycisphaerae bacterium]
MGWTPEGEARGGGTTEAAQMQEDIDMSLTTAMHTGLTGMDVHTKQLDVIAHNITNINTTAFKSSRALFETQLSNNLSFGTAPSATTGGTNPSQIGLGVKFAGTQRNHTNGPIQPTGIGTDLAIEGSGFFALSQNGEKVYTRDGSFDLDANRNLVGFNGGIVQGYGVDNNFNIVPGVTGNINVPVGTLTLSEPTRNVDFAGNLNVSGPTAVNGSLSSTQALEDTLGGALAPATLLSQVGTAGSGVASFTTGDVLTVQGVEKGGKELGNYTFEVGPTNTTGSDTNGTTLQDLMTFLEGALGINKDPVIGDGAGIVLNGADELEIAGNFGVVNDINIQSADLVSTGAINQPLLFNRQSAADGESVRTSFATYDSLGTAQTVDLTMVLIDKNATGSSWRYFGESLEDTDVSRVLESAPGLGGTGTLDFDTFGQLTNVSNATLTLNRTNTGAVDPLSFTMDFAPAGDSLTALTDTSSTLAAIFQDGSPVGKLDSFSIGEDGVISGAFTNGQVRSLGQVALASFTNPEGLI